MSLVVVNGPAVEPVTLAEAKTFLRVGHGDDDALIAAMLAAARAQVEALARVALIEQTWRLSVTAWPARGRLTPRLAPLKAIAAARLVAGDGTTRALDHSRIRLDAAANAIVLPAGLAGVMGEGALELDLVFGYGAGAQDVPALLRQAIRQLLAHWYDNRGLVAIGQSVALLPGSVAAMLAAHRTLAL